MARYFSCGGQEAEDIPGGDGRKKGKSGAHVLICEGSKTLKDGLRWKGMTFENTYSRLRYKIKYWHRLRRSFLRSEAKVTEFYERDQSVVGAAAATRLPTFGAATAKETG